MSKYELAEVNFGRDYHHETIIGILTGYNLEEILGVHKNKKIWFTKDYFHVFHTLGFNTNARFQKFDPETKYPCIMRCKRVAEINGYWFGWVYYDHWVWDTHGQIWDFDHWIDTHKGHYRVTSMLQVWI